jgi:hypothetical protein
VGSVFHFSAKIFVDLSLHPTPLQHQSCISPLLTIFVIQYRV